MATVSKHEPRNWDLCKEVGLFGYTRGMAKCEPGDHLLIWFGGRGYIGFGLVTGYARRPSGKAEAPWSGGTSRFTSVVPFKMQLELPNDGLYLAFVNNIQKQTGINTAKLQHSLSAIPDEAAVQVTRQLLEMELGKPSDAEMFA
ncbi:MAG: hypothetical protein ACO1N6_03375 [Microcella sp.]